MKLQPDRFAVPTVSAHGPGWVAINGEKITSSLILSSRGPRLPWPWERFEALDSASFDPVAALQPELVIFGSGARLRFPQPGWLTKLMALRIGVETMDTPAACRTYNILAGEGRYVIAALLVETPE